MTTPYKEFEARALEAGVNTELAHAMYNVVRDAQEHDWMPLIQDWAADEDNLIALALAEPERMAEACELLFVSDGLMYDEDQRNAGISDKKRSEIERWIFTNELRAKHVVRPWRS